MSKQSPYGSWKSPISSSKLAESNLKITELQKSNGTIIWNSILTDNNATYQLSSLQNENYLPSGFSARSLVYNYGGGSYCMNKNTTYFTNYSPLQTLTNDQRIHKLEKGKLPIPLTPEYNARYGDLSYSKLLDKVVCVKEDFSINEEGVLSIVLIDPNGEKEALEIISGNDYYSNPTISNDGNFIAWLEWSKPHMPWDFNELWIGEIKDNKVINKKCIQKGASSFQPLWSEDSTSLFYSNDTFNWWTIFQYKVQKEKSIQFEKGPKKAEFGLPQWDLGLSCFDQLNKNTLAACYTKKGKWFLSLIQIKEKKYQNFTLYFSDDKVKEEITEISNIKCLDDEVYFIGGGPLISKSIFKFNPTTEKVTLIKGNGIIKDKNNTSLPKTIKVRNEHTGEKCYAFYYPPKNEKYNAPINELPPLLIKTHGGPTSMTTTDFNKEIQYFTTRGIAVVDINYRGSTGYGRKYRLSLYKQWGVFDRNDCINTALQLSNENKIDLNRCIARGVSAGGYLTVVQAVYTTLLAAGCSISGITNMELLYAGTHKFEKYYIIELLGSTNKKDAVEGEYYDYINTYKLRSPYYVSAISTTPMMFIQGRQDHVVPVDQTEVMVEKLNKQKIPVAKLIFDDEQHGIRKANNLIKAMDSEFYFYSQILGFIPADNLEPIEIENWK